MERTEIENTKKIIEDLAYGINPFTGEKIPDDSLLNNVELARCFFTTVSIIEDAMILEDIFNNNTKSKKPRDSSKSFQITEEQKKLVFSQEPINVTSFVNKIRDVIKDESMRIPKTVQITNWLVKNEFLIDDLNFYTGKSRRIPSEKGKSIGITTIERDYGAKRYTICLYSLDVQKLILDNINDIMCETSDNKNTI